MQRVTGLGGVFFQAQDPQKLYRWYERHLGLKRDPTGSSVCFFWREMRGRSKGMTVWSLFPRKTPYFQPGRANFMLNYRVKDLDAVLKALRREKVWIDPKREDEYGRFAWIQDPEGNRIELWQPPAEKRAKRRRKKPARKSRQTKRARAR